MSPRPPLWWRAPLSEEAIRAFNYCLKPTRADEREVLAATITLQALFDSHAIAQLLGHLFGKTGPAVLSVATRRMRRELAPSHRPLLQLRLQALAIDDATLRLPRPVLSSADRQRLAPALRRETRERQIIDRLPMKQQQRLGAAGYLLLVAALAAQAVKSPPRGYQRQRTATGRQRRGGTTTKRQQAEIVAIELLHTTAWLYGKPLISPVVSLVQAVAGVEFKRSSLFWRARALR
jgi:hypothetical protein